MIYICNNCYDVSFNTICKQCEHLADVVHGKVPLNPVYYKEFQYQSLGLIGDLINKRKQTRLLKEDLISVLDKYQKFKIPYFVNYTYFPSNSEEEDKEEIMNYGPVFGGEYSDLDLFYRVLVNKGFHELEKYPELTNKLLLTTKFEAFYNGYASEIQRHIKHTLYDTLRSWIEESGSSFRQEICMFLYYVWEKKLMLEELSFNEQAEKDLSVPLASTKTIYEISEMSEKIYYDLLVERLDIKLTNFDPSDFCNIHMVDAMDGFEFEAFLLNLFRTIGYDVQETSKTGDQGADLFVEKFGIKTVIQAKRFFGNVGNAAVQQALAAKNFYRCDRAIVMTNSYFTKSAKELADATGVELVGRKELIEYLDEYNYYIIDKFAEAEIYDEDLTSADH